MALLRLRDTQQWEDLDDVLGKLAHFINSKGRKIRGVESGLQNAWKLTGI